MRIAVFGAAGRTGRLIVEQALGHGHDVVAFVRSTPVSIAHPRLSVLVGDAVADHEAVSRAVAGAGAVAFALSIGESGNHHVHEEAIGNVIYAMAEHGVRKLAAVSSASVGRPPESAFTRGLKSLMGERMSAARDDLGAMERRIMASDLAWTIVRPSGLSDGPQTGAYRMTRDGSPIAGSERVSRADVAAVMLAALETAEYERRILTVAV